MLQCLYPFQFLEEKVDFGNLSSKKDMENKLKSDLASLEERVDFGNLSMCSFHSNSTTSSNLAIATFVTAYARIHMSSFKNLKGFSLYYSDTDSLFLNKPLPSNVIDDKKLGFLKLENVFSSFIAVGAKSWIGVNPDGSIVSKMKGSKNKINYLDFLNLLQLNSSFKIDHDKWYRSFKDSSITIKKTPFTVTLNSNKRLLVFNNGVLISTKNITVIDNKILSQLPIIF